MLNRNLAAVAVGFAVTATIMVVDDKKEQLKDSVDDARDTVADAVATDDD